MSRLLIVIPGNPGDGSINAAYKPGTRRGKRGKVHATMVKTKLGEAFQRRATLAAIRASAADPHNSIACSDAKTLGATVTSYWPRRRHLDGVPDLGLGDVDAPIKATLDALQHAGIVDDDVRFIEVTARKRHDPANPRIEVEVWPADEL